MKLASACWVSFTSGKVNGMRSTHEVTLWIFTESLPLDFRPTHYIREEIDVGAKLLRPYVGGIPLGLVAVIHEVAAYFGLLQCLADSQLHFFHDRGRGFRRRKHAVPARVRDISGHALADGGNVGQRTQALGAGKSPRARPAPLYQRH